MYFKFESCDYGRARAAVTVRLTRAGDPRPDILAFAGTTERVAERWLSSVCI